MNRLFNRKNVSILALVLGLTMVLVGCGGGSKTTAQTFEGKDGIKIETPGNWKHITNEADIKAMFTSEDTDISFVMLAAESDTGRITVEKYNIEEYYKGFLEVLDEIKEVSKGQDKTAMMSELESIGYSEYEREFLEKIVDGKELTEEELELLFQEYYFQDWNANEQSGQPTYKYVGSIKTNINGKPAIIHEYTYDQEGGKITLFETDLKKDSEIFVNIIWGYEDDFKNNRDEFQKILESFKY